MTSGNKKTVSYWDPVTGMTTRTVEPDMSVAEIEAREGKRPRKLKASWSVESVDNLSPPLRDAERQALQDRLFGIFSLPYERDVVRELAESHHFHDDRLLKLIGRLAGETETQHSKRSRTVSKLQRLIHEKQIWQQDKTRLQDEVKILTDDVRKLIDERDEAQRLAKNARTSVDRVALHGRVTDLERELAKAQAAEDAAKQALEIVKRDTQRNVELALTEYETGVMGKLGEVAADHKIAVEENKELKRKINGLELALENNTNAQVNKESAMSETENVNTNEVGPQETLRAGDKVFCKISNEGPFVLVTQVDVGVVKYSNPVPGVKNHFNVGEVTVESPWLIRDRAGTMRCLPAPVLTKETPKRTFSFGGVKGLITSDVTAKLAQFAIWGAILTALFMRG